MDEWVNGIALVVGVGVAVLVLQRTRKRFGVVVSACLSVVAGLAAAGLVLFAVGFSIGIYSGFARLILGGTSDDYAWDLLRSSIEKSALDTRRIYEADPVIELEFKRAAMSLARKHWNEPSQLEPAVIAIAIGVFDKHIAPRAAYGSDAAVEQWGRAYATYLKGLAEDSKQRCGEAANGDNTTWLRIGAAVAPQLNRMIAATVSAYRSSDAGNTLPTVADLEPVWREVFLGAGTPFSGHDVTAFARRATLPPRRVCDLTLMLLKRIRALPSGQRVMALRAVLHEFATSQRAAARRG